MCGIAGIFKFNNIDTSKDESLINNALIQLAKNKDRIQMEYLVTIIVLFLKQDYLL